MRDGRIELDFGDGRYPFRLAWAQLISLQEKTDAGPFFLQQRMLKGEWRVQDLAETIRWGLIGGGMTPIDASKLVRMFVENRPLLETLPIAMGVLAAALIGHPEESSLGEAGGGVAATAGNGSNSPTVDGASPPSSVSPESPASPTATSST